MTAGATFLKWILLVFLLLGRSVWGETQYMTGNDLLMICKNEALRVVCASYIAGVVDAHNLFVESGYIRRVWCLPEDVTTKQLEQIVINYLKTTPEHLEKDRSGLIIIALMEAYSCN